MTDQPSQSTQSDTPSSQPRFTWRFRLIAVTVLIIATLLLAEISLRILGIHKGGIIIQADHWTGVRHIPNRTLVQESEGYAIVRINAHGFRDHEMTVEKPPGTLRIALVGDSYVEAAQVALEDAVSEKIESRLNDTHPTEVLNFGLSGYSTAQEYLNIKHHILPFDPDMIILSMTVTNDIRDNHQDLTRTVRPFYTLNTDGSLKLDTTFRQPEGRMFRLRSNYPKLWNAISWLASNSRLGGLVIEAARSVSQHRRQPTQNSEPSELTPATLRDLNVYNPDTPAPWDEAWTITEKLLLKIRDLCRENNIKLLVVIQATARQIDPETRTYFQTHHPEFDLDYPERRLVAFFAQNDITALPLSPAFRAHKQSTGQYLHGFGKMLGGGHWNEKGHDLAAKTIHEFLVANKLIPEHK